MIGFFLKKAFFDGWDNLFALAAFNIIHLVLLSVFIVLPISLGAGDALTFACIGSGIVAMSLWQSLCAFSLNEASDYRSVGFKASLAHFPKAIKPGLAAGLVNALMWLSVTVGIPFYLMQKSLLGVFFASLLFWMALVVTLASQYFLPLAARRGGTIKSLAKSSLILLFDNVGFSLFLALHNLVSLAISLFSAFLAPGLAGVAIASAAAVKLRLMKYEWLESNPGADRKHIPWEALLVEEKELVGERTLKGMIFPWKEGK